MIDILQGVILFFLAADLIVRWVFRIRDARGTDVDELKTVTSSYGGGERSRGLPLRHPRPRHPLPARRTT